MIENKNKNKNYTNMEEKGGSEDDANFYMRLCKMLSILELIKSFLMVMSNPN